jgi:hypothetical protein
MRAVPISWIDQPGGSRSRPTLMLSAPAARSISSAVSAMSFAILSSLSPNLKSKRRTGMPQASFTSGSRRTRFSLRGSTSPKPPIAKAAG